jgi:hypothetical protein
MREVGGGFERLRSQGQEGSIEFQIYYKEDYIPDQLPMN